MTGPIWSDKDRMEGDPVRIEELLRSSAFIVGEIDDYLRRLEQASGEDFSTLRSVARNALVYQSGSEHLALRRLIAPFFARQAMLQWSGVIAEAVEAALDRLQAAPRPDLMKDFASPLFLSIITRMVGFRDDGSGRLYPAIIQAQRVSEPWLSLRNLRAMNGEMAYLLGVLPPLGDCTADGPETLLAYLGRNRAMAPEGTDLRQTALALVLAANTTVQTLGLILYGMLTGDAALWEDASSPDWAERCLDRLISCYPATLTLVRQAGTDTQLGGCPYAKGQATILDVTEGNARLRAAGSDHTLSFGAGVHKCPGQQMALQMIGMIIPALAQRFPKLMLFKDLAEFRSTPMVHCPTALPCELDGRSRRVSARLCDIKDFDTAAAIVNNDADFSPPEMEAHLRPLAEGSGHDLSQAIRIARNAMFFMSGERHAVMRRAVGESLGGNRLPVWHGLIDDQVAQALDRLAGSAAPDLIHDFADPVFRGITRPILGIATSDDALFDQLAPRLQDVLEPWLPMRELLRLQDVFDTLLNLMALPGSPQSGAGAPLLSSLLASDLPDFDAQDIRALVLVLYGASFNLAHTLGNVLHWILTRPPEERREVAEPRWIEENLERLIALCASPKYIYRMARHPVTLDGVAVKARDTVRLQLLSINRGVSTGNLSFGHGLHRCVGAALSRLLLRRAIPALFKRYPAMALVPQAHSYFQMSQTVALASLPCRPGAPA